ncbi:protein kinase [Spirillospora sp. NPDC052242]
MPDTGTAPGRAPRVHCTVPSVRRTAEGLGVGVAEARGDGPAGAWRPGRVVDGRYEVVRELGRGGMGVVYQVRHRGWGSDLAVKVPRREMFRDEADRERFTTEAETWVGLGLHPNVCGCHYVRTIDAVPTVFAEHVSGGSLDGGIADGSLYSGSPGDVLARILDLAVQMAWGLEHAHSMGLVHRDVKPANVLLDDGWTAKVTDFGLAVARDTHGRETLERPGVSVAVPNGGMMTPQFASPEQLAGRPLGRATDVHSLAATIVAMFTKGPVWLVGIAAGEALEDHRATATADAPEIPDDVADLLRACLRTDPGARPRSMAAIADSLQESYRRATGRAYPRRVPTAAELHADELNNRALSFLDLGRPGEADRALTAALRADPHHPGANFNSGLLRWRRGEITDERFLFLLDRLDQELGDPGQGVLSRALVEMERGDLRAARALLEDVDPEREGHQEARHLLRTLRDGGIVHAGCVDTRRVPWRTRGRAPAGYEIRMSADWRLALTPGEDHGVRFWDAADGRELRTLYGHGDRVISVDMSADGRRAVSASWDGTVRLWDLTSGACLAVGEVTPWTQGLGERKRREREEAESRQGLIRHRTYIPSNSPELNSACSPARLSADGAVVAWVEADGRIQVWDFDRAAPRTTIDGHDGASHLELSTTGDRALTCFGGMDDGLVRLWDLEGGRIVWEADGRDCLFARFGPGDRTVITADAERTLRVWEPASGRMLGALTMPEGRHVASAALSEDARVVLIGSWDGTVSYWDLANGRCLRTFTGHQGKVSAVQLGPGGASARSASLDGTIRTWRLPGRFEAALRVSRPRGHGEVSGVESRLESLLTQAKAAMGSGAHAESLAALREARALPGCERLPRVLETWKDLSGRTARVGLRSTWISWGLPPGSGMALDISRDGRLLASAAKDSRINLWELSTGAQVRSIETGQRGVGALRFSRDGAHLTSIGADDEIRVWETETGRCVNAVRLPRAHRRVLSRDGRLALVAHGVEGSVRLWDAFTGECLHVMPGPHPVTALWIDAGGRRFLTAGNDRHRDPRSEDPALIRLWDSTDGRCLLTLRPESKEVKSACMTPDGSFILAGGSPEKPARRDGGWLSRIRMWDASTGNLVRTFDPVPEEASRLQVTPDGRFAVAAGWRPDVHIWEIATGRSIRVLDGHKGGGALEVGPDGTCVVTSDGEHEVRVWELDWELEAPAPEYTRTPRTDAPTPRPRQAPAAQPQTPQVPRNGIPRGNWLQDEEFRELVRQVAGLAIPAEPDVATVVANAAAPERPARLEVEITDGIDLNDEVGFLRAAWRVMEEELGPPTTWQGPGPRMLWRRPGTSLAVGLSSSLKVTLEALGTECRTAARELPSTWLAADPADLRPPEPEAIATDWGEARANLRAALRALCSDTPLFPGRFILCMQADSDPLRFVQAWNDGLDLVVESTGFLHRPELVDRDRAARLGPQGTPPQRRFGDAANEAEQVSRAADMLMEALQVMRVDLTDLTFSGTMVGRGRRFHLDLPRLGPRRGAPDAA